jgi:hypothetical protein
MLPQKGRASLATRFLLALLLAAFYIPAIQVSSQNAGYYPKGGADDGPQDVSLIQLIANPQLYHMKRVRVIGFLHLEFEGNAIYLHREDLEYGITQNAIWINLPKDITTNQMKAVNGGYVICTAQFVANRHGHMGLFSGEFEGVTRLQMWADRPRGNLVIPPPPPQQKQRAH